MNVTVSRERVLKWGIKNRINSVNAMFQIIPVKEFGVRYTFLRVCAVLSTKNSPYPYFIFIFLEITFFTSKRILAYS